MNITPVGLSLRPELYQEGNKLAGSVWPEFMLHDAVANLHFYEFIQTFPDHQFILLNETGEVCGMVNSVPVSLPEGPEALSPEGWDWAVVKSLEDRAKNRKPDTLIGLQVCIDKRLQGKGLSDQAVRIMQNFRKERGYSRLVIPVRPTEKHLYPLIPMEDYISWKRKDGLPVDPWLRVHLRAGGRILRVCDRSMKIDAPVTDWENWTGLRFPGSGEYIVPGALCPVTIDRTKDTGLYTEPNVWILHEKGNPED